MSKYIDTGKYVVGGTIEEDVPLHYLSYIYEDIPNGGLKATPFANPFRIGTEKTTIEMAEIMKEDAISIGLEDAKIYKLMLVEVK